jgi:hypothetical protein
MTVRDQQGRPGIAIDVCATRTPIKRRRPAPRASAATGRMPVRSGHGMTVPQQPKWERQTTDHDERDRYLRIAIALEKLVRIVDAGIGSYLNARFAGKGNDRWSRR